MFADRVAQNASATRGSSFCLFFGFPQKTQCSEQTIDERFHSIQHWCLQQPALAVCHDSKCKETVPLVRNSDFADLCGLGSRGLCEACDHTSPSGRQARRCRWNVVVSRWWHRLEAERLFWREHASGSMACPCWRTMTHTRHPYLWESFEMVVC